MESLLLVLFTSIEGGIFTSVSTRWELTAEPTSWVKHSPGFWMACWNPCCKHPWAGQDDCWSNEIARWKMVCMERNKDLVLISLKTVETHSLSSSNVLTENRGEVGSLCWTSTWFLFRTRERRMSLFRRDCSARSTLSTSFNQPPFSLSMFPGQVHKNTNNRQKKKKNPSMQTYN